MITRNVTINIGAPAPTITEEAGMFNDLQDGPYVSPKPSEPAVWIDKYRGYSDVLIILVQNESGRVIGKINGNPEKEPGNWYAFKETSSGSERLGEFVSEEFAKKN